MSAGQTQATPRPWEIDTVRNDGDYGDGGPDASSGYDSFSIVDASGRVLFDSLNRNTGLTEIREDRASDEGVTAWDDPARCDAELIVIAVNAYDQHQQLAQSVLSWWRSKSAETVTDDEGSEHPSVFEEPPEMVKLALQLLPETKT